jgi:hypothetical protein
MEKGLCQMDDVGYLHLQPNQTPPDIRISPFRAVVVIDDPVSDEWRGLASEWLVRSGCLYMVAWGLDCSLWDDSVDHANLAAFDYGDIPDDKFVMTTWHDREPLSEAFWFAAHSALHPDIDLTRTLVVHISHEERREQLLAAYNAAARAIT